MSDAPNPKISAETYALIDSLVVAIISALETTGDGPAALLGEREARKLLHKQCAPGHRAVAKQELYDRFTKAFAPIAMKMYEAEFAAERRRA